MKLEAMRVSNLIKVLVDTLAEHGDIAVHANLETRDGTIVGCGSQDPVPVYGVDAYHHGPRSSEVAVRIYVDDKDD